MIINWLLYSVLAATMLVAAGFAFEYAARALRLPTRWVWIAVIVLSTVFSVSTLVRQLPHAAGDVVEVSVMPGVVVSRSIELPQQAPPKLFLLAVRSINNVSNLNAFVGVDTHEWMPLDGPLMIACAALGLIGLTALVITFARMNNVAYSLNNAIVEGVPVLLSRNIGPALLGVFRFRVVLPRWVTEMSSADLRTILKHEQEHALAGDPTLTLGALAIVSMQPWNLPLWVAMSRLRLAIEADCDARVLGAAGDARHYGKLLVRVYERAQSGLTPLTALVTGSSQLEARIRRIVNAAPQAFSPKTAGALAVAFLLSTFAYTLKVTAQKSPDSAAIALQQKQPPVARARHTTLRDSSSADSTLTNIRAQQRRMAQRNSAPTDTPPTRAERRRRAAVRIADSLAVANKSVDSATRFLAKELAGMNEDSAHFIQLRGASVRRADSLNRISSARGSNKVDAETLRARYGLADSMRFVRGQNTAQYQRTPARKNSSANSRGAQSSTASRQVAVRQSQNSTARLQSMARQPDSRNLYTRTRADSILTAKARAAYNVMTTEEKREFERRAFEARARYSGYDTLPVTPLRGSGKARADSTQR